MRRRTGANGRENPQKQMPRKGGFVVFIQDNDVDEPESTNKLCDGAWLDTTGCRSKLRVAHHTEALLVCVRVDVRGDVNAVEKGGTRAKRTLTASEKQCWDLDIDGALQMPCAQVPVHRTIVAALEHVRRACVNEQHRLMAVCDKGKRGIGLGGAVDAGR